MPNLLQRLVSAWRGTFPGDRLLGEPHIARLMAVGVVIGAVGGLAAAGFDQLLAVIGENFLGTRSPSIDAPAFPAVLLVPISGGIIGAGIIRWGTRNRRATGISDVIDATWNHAGNLSMRDGIASALAAAAVVGSGQSGGREGPVVQLSSAIASHICRRLGIPPRHMRVLVAAGAASGIAASFNTPVGAAFFALEIVLGNFAMQMFAPVVAATVTGTVVGQALLGHKLALKLPPFVLKDYRELLFYLVLGALCGAVGVWFKASLRHMERAWVRFGVPQILRPAIAGLVVGVLAFAGIHTVMGNGYGYLQLMLSGASGLTLGTLTLVVAAKLLATVFTTTSRAGAGIFSPSLFIGATTGTLFGTIVHTIWPDITESAGAYGMVGMGAVAAAVTHSPLTIILMMFEMTGNYEVILPLLSALAVSGIVARALGSESEYHIQLAQRGIRVERSREELVMNDLRVADLMMTDPLPTIGAHATFTDLAHLLLDRRDVIAIVLDEENRYSGVVHLHDVKRLLAESSPDTRVAELQSRNAAVLRPEDALATALPHFFRCDMNELPVVDATGRVVGVLWERDVIGAYHREVLRADDLLARVESDEPDGRHRDFFELPPGQVLRSVAVPNTMVGRTLREVELTRRYGCQALAILTPDPRTGRADRAPATADRILAQGERLVVLGPREEVESLGLGELEEDTVSLSPAAFQELLARAEAFDGLPIEPTSPAPPKRRK